MSLIYLEMKLYKVQSQFIFLTLNKTKGENTWACGNIVDITFGIIVHFNSNEVFDV